MLNFKFATLSQKQYLSVDYSISFFDHAPTYFSRMFSDKVTATAKSKTP